MCSPKTKIKGQLVIIGGGDRTVEIMRTIVDLAGGTRASFIVIPNASSDPVGTGIFQVQEFRELGVSKVELLFTRRENADQDSVLAKLKGVTGVFFSGGDQNRLTRDLLNTRLIARLHEIYEKGGIISGTSAGAAVMSKIMITGDEAFNTDSTESFVKIQEHNIIATEGFGFIDRAIIDQHFVKRKRHNRLISLVLENPDQLGIGIDESTAIVVKPDETFMVMGENSVIVYDASKADNIHIDTQNNLGANNLRLHVLTAGQIFNLRTKRTLH
jgi:cyanophycinase